MNSYSFLALATLIIVISAAPWEFPIKIEVGEMQSIRVNGTLMCNDQPAAGVKIKLYDEEVTVDALLDERFTNETGIFEVEGKKSEVSSIDPKINIYHRCSYEGICYKKISIEIPDEFIAPGEVPTRTYDIGTLNLASKFASESVDCFN